MTCPATGPGWRWDGSAFVDARLFCVLPAGHPGPHFGQSADGSLQPFEAEKPPLTL